MIQLDEFSPSLNNSDNSNRDASQPEVIKINQERVVKVEAGGIEMEQSFREREVVKKIDLHILPVLILMNSLSLIDRTNIGLARLYGLEQDLQLTGWQYSCSLSIFFAGYTIFEIPSNILLKKFSPPVWFSVILIAWGGSTMCLAASSNFISLATIRFFLGLAESGMFPGIVFYLSYWYPRQEQGTRMALVTSVGLIASSLGGLLAYAISHLDDILGLKSWRWIFMLEGMPSVLLGLVTWILLPDSPSNSKFLTPAEKEILIQRLKTSHVDLDIHNFSWSQVKLVLKDPKLYLYMTLYFSNSISSNTVNLLFPTLINSLGFNRVISSLLTTPPVLIGAITAILVAWHSDRVMIRSYHILSCLTLTILGFILIQTTTYLPLQYSSLLLISSGSFSSLSLTISWLNNNMLTSSTTASFAPPAVIMSGALGGFLAGQLYPPSDAPRYLLSHQLNLASLILGITCTLTLRHIMVRHNTQSNLIPPTTLTKLKPTNNYQFIL